MVQETEVPLTTSSPESGSESTDGAPPTPLTLTSPLYNPRHSTDREMAEGI